MYESQTFSSILQRMLDRVPSDVDKREGSVIYDALAPAAWELAGLYAQLDSVLRLGFASTSTGTYLDLKVADYGIFRKTATKAQRKGLFYGSSNALIDVPIGSRFGVEALNYVVVERLSIGNYVLECETAGAAGNAYFRPLLPIDYINGLVRAELADILVPGTDQETDAELKKRYADVVQAPSTSGNKADYRNWALEVAGVGGVQVLPLWDGPGTVKVVILDANKLPASSLLVSEVQEYIAPVSGTGEGQAPIGADVTVAAAAGIDIDVEATVVLSGSRTLAQVQEDFETALTDYLKSIAFGADPGVKYVRIGAMLLDVPGVQDYSGLIVNGGTGNVTVPIGFVAVKGTVTLDE
ncbi:baseplate J/gp47 family protein [Paenibacillus sp. TAB 01]|uniref:baseplate J/gp47 family protein n=1 Tax=Paenibacillus sp. TAB 01 TaxID=3368988 RepID=UPI0037523EC2